MTITLATRSSPLALWQATRTREELVALARGDRPEAEPDDGNGDERGDVVLLEIQSSGDLDRESELARFGRIGIFTVEVDRAVVDGRAHVGVHSMKDLTTTLSEGVVLAGALARGPVEDVLVSRDGATLSQLERGARVGTGSIRRAALLRRERRDLVVAAIRGNVATRLEKLDRGEYDAIVLARAGLVRLGLEGRIVEVLDPERFLPAVGQGIVGLTCRADDAHTAAALERVTCPAAWAAALAERALLRALHGGCNAPIGGHARVDGPRLRLSARVLSADGQTQLEGRTEGATLDAEALGTSLAFELLARGARQLVEASAT